MVLTAAGTSPGGTEVVGRVSWPADVNDSAARAKLRGVFIEADFAELESHRSQAVGSRIMVQAHEDVPLPAPRADCTASP